MLLGVKVTSATMTPAQRESARDDEWQAIQDLLYPEQGLFTIKQTRADYGGNSISREIKGELLEYAAWKWTPDSVEAGLFGRYDQPLLFVPLQFQCPFPWFTDTDGTVAVNGATLNGSANTTAITNPGLVSVGLRAEITAASGTGTVALTNAVGPTALAGARLIDITPTATPVIFDWYYTDPLSWSLTQGATDLTEKLDIGSSVGLARGANTLGYQVTSGSLTTGLITVRYKAAWGVP
jgi:hypothetical protein